MNDSSTFIVIIIVLAISIGLFFLLREFFCWYWKINALLEESQRTNELLEDTNEILEDILTEFRYHGNSTNNFSPGSEHSINNDQHIVP